MKFSLGAVLAYSAAVEAHAIFQQLSVNGKSAGSLKGLRAPNNNNPVQDVNSQNIICGQPGSKDSTIIDVAPGDRLGAWYQHVIGGAQFPGDRDNPIAASHKGPVMAYLAKVDNAATAPITGQKWFKIADDGFNTQTRKWGVDNMISNNGWAYFNMPSCIAPGQYLLRVELIGLHGANVQGQAQFYTSCAHIRVSGSGTFSPAQTVSFPGAYQATHPGIKTSIYGLTGQPDNNGAPYTSPGPAPITC